MTKCRFESCLSRARRRSIARARIVSHAKLHLGCGSRAFAGWINVDGYVQDGVDLVWDLRRRLPFSDGAAELVYSEHTLEHLAKRDALALLGECYRVLQPGGRLRLGLPDAELYIRAYAERKPEFFDFLRKRWAMPSATPIELLNHSFRMNGNHQYAWDFVTLSAALQRTGFRDVTRWASCSASRPELCLDNPDHVFESLYLEAQK
jgi:predicted SAM-dependent methyltransferase